MAVYKTKRFIMARKKLNLFNKESVDKFCIKLKSIDLILNFVVYQKTGNELFNKAQDIIIKNSMINSNIIATTNETIIAVNSL